MSKYFIAKTIEGKEYKFSMSSAMLVSTKSKDLICESLNKSRYDLKEGQIWHIYENDYYYDEQIDKKATIRGGYIRQSYR